jgi:hypothetical protein
MRKFVLALMGAIALVAMTANLASGAKRAHARSSAALCGTLYTPACTPPKATVASKVACVNTGKILTFPVTASANAGLRKITVTFRGKVVKTVKVGGSATKKRFTVVISTRGFRPGLFTLTVTATDARGKTVTKRAHFTICHPKPVFTG